MSSHGYGDDTFDGYEKPSRDRDPGLPLGRSRCQGIAGRLFGHKFEARFEERELPPDFDAKPFLYGTWETKTRWQGFPLDTTSGGPSLDTIERLIDKQLASVRKEQRYVGETCVRCGKKI